jgi:ribosome-associated protein
MKKDGLREQVAAAVAACEEKKADRLSVLELEKSSGAFTDYFVICSGSNPRQIQAISDEVEERLSGVGLKPKSVEGYKQAEWVLLDYVDFVVHVFSEKARAYYDLERLWKSAKNLHPSDLMAKRSKPAKSAKKTNAAKSTKKSSAKASRARKTTAAKTTRGRKG